MWEVAWRPPTTSIRYRQRNYVCAPKMIYTDDDESVTVTRMGASSAIPAPALSAARGYVIEASGDDETFIINGEVFEAKTYCFNFDKGDRVVFVSGSAVGACVSAKLLNIRTQKMCDVWCE